MDYQMNILSLLGLFGAGMTMNQFWNQIRDLQKKIQDYEQTPIYCPSELANIKNQSKITAFVSGFIQSNNKLEYDKIWIEKRTYDLYFGQKKQLQSIQIQGLPLFNLIDSEQALVKIWRKSALINVKPALTQYLHDEQLYQLNLFQKLTNLFLRFLSILKLDKIKGFKIGELRTAYGIANGDFCTVFGDIMFDKEGISMHNLRHILKDKGQLLTHLRSILKKKKIAYSIISLICCLLIYIFGKNIIYTIKQLIRQRQLNKLDKLRGIKQIQLEKYDCAICQSEPRDVILKPCKHLSICHKCLKSLPQMKCPICKSAITDQIDIYFS